MPFSLQRCLPRLLAGTAIAASTVGEMRVAWALPAPPYAAVETFETTVPATADPADIYYPVSPAEVEGQQWPWVLLLQGAFVDKSAYSEFAAAVARYGFVVVVPNHERSLINPRTGEPVTGFAPEQRQVHDVLNLIELLAADPTSPLNHIVDSERYGLVGHSIGGYVGISAIQGSCLPLICAGDTFEPPPELDAGVFYGTTFEAPPESGTFSPIENRVPIALIAGSEDGEANTERVLATFEQIQNGPRAMIVVDGANHYGITNENSDRAVNPPMIDQPEAIATIAYWTAQFLQAHLGDDTLTSERSDTAAGAGAAVRLAK